MSITPSIRETAIRAFSDRLQSKRTDESAWQALFVQCPYVLTEAIPLRVSAFYPQIALESKHYDVAIIEQAEFASSFVCYGVVEQRRPRDLLIRFHIPRPEAAAHNPNASGGVRNAIQDELDRSHFFVVPQFACWIGFPHYIAMVVARTKDLLRQFLAEVERLQAKNLFPPGARRIICDQVFNRFFQVSTPLLLLEALPPGTNEPMGVREPRAIPLEYNDAGVGEERITSLVTPRLRIPVYPSRYRQVFGVPRRIWPTEKGRWIENYYYERRRTLGDDAMAELMVSARARNLPYLAIEIEGEIDSHRRRWKPGAELKLFIPGQGVVTVAPDDWVFSVYEGDSIYLDEGRSFFISQYE